jgi:hypothetical protein
MSKNTLTRICQIEKVILILKSEILFAKEDNTLKFAVP